MIDVLKPCPFCGGEAIYGKSEASGRVRTVCVDCLASTDWLAGTDEAAAAWNSRAERTCRIIEDGCGLAHCSECGFEFDPYDCSGIPEEGVPYEYDGRYCKNCGAKVAVE